MNFFFGLLGLAGFFRCGGFTVFFVDQRLRTFIGYWRNLCIFLFGHAYFCSALRFYGPAEQEKDG
jgi:hypothetical protein